MWGRARAAAAPALDRNLEVLERVGCRITGRPSPLEARIEAEGGQSLRVRMMRHGRVFGGSYALEVATAEPVLPPTRGLVGRGRGLVSLRGIAFRARRGDEVGRRLAQRLEADDGLRAALTNVHFERIHVEPDGRPVIRHMGGALVWVLFPPVLRAVPLVEEQARATVAALEAFAAAGRA